MGFSPAVRAGPIPRRRSPSSGDPIDPPRKASDKAPHPLVINTLAERGIDVDFPHLVTHTCRKPTALPEGGSEATTPPLATLGSWCHHGTKAREGGKRHTDGERRERTVAADGRRGCPHAARGLLGRATPAPAFRVAGPGPLARPPRAGCGAWPLCGRGCRDGSARSRPGRCPDVCLPFLWVCKWKRGSGVALCPTSRLEEPPEASRGGGTACAPRPRPRRRVLFSFRFVF